MDQSLKEQLEITEAANKTESTVNKKFEKVQNTLKKERKSSEFFRRELERNPKYVMLFVLQEVRRASLVELQRTVHRPSLWVKREVQSLVQEGWIQMTDDENVEIAKEFPPI